MRSSSRKGTGKGFNTNTATTETTHGQLQQQVNPAAVDQHTLGNQSQPTTPSNLTTNSSSITTTNNQNLNNSTNVDISEQPTSASSSPVNTFVAPVNSPSHNSPSASSNTLFNAAPTPSPKNQSKALTCITIAALAVGAAAFTAGFIYLGLPLAMALAGAGIALLITLGLGYGGYRLFNYCRNNKSETTQSNLKK